jgi:uncharacterized membrane protein
MPAPLGLGVRCVSIASPFGEQGEWRWHPTAEGEVTRQILASYEAGDLIRMCAWCRRVDIDGEWHLAPRAALTAIQARSTLSHSICPDCAAAEVSQAP